MGPWIQLLFLPFNDTTLVSHNVDLNQGSRLVDEQISAPALLDLAHAEMPGFLTASDPMLTLWLSEEGLLPHGRQVVRAADGAFVVHDQEVEDLKGVAQTRVGGRIMGLDGQGQVRSIEIREPQQA